LTTAAINLVLPAAHDDFASGETLSVEYNVDPTCADEIEALEISVLWFTEGKGDEDMAVHFFERIEKEAAGGVDFRQPRRFDTVLPYSPLSYEGVIVKIHWCVRARAFLARGKQVVEERPFRLGNIPSAHTILP
jgi:hypothetical protein